MRKLIKKIILWFSSILHHNHTSKIVFYHDVYGENKYTDMGTSINMFKKHIQTFREKGYSIVSKIQNPNNEIKICFDDGFRGIYDTKQFFVDNGLHPTVFLAVSLIGKPGYLSKEEILELQRNGFIFQSHGWSHKDLTKFTKDELEKELSESKRFLSDLLDHPVDEICFPIGYFSQLVLDECLRFGYKTMYSSIPGNYYDKLFINELRTRNLLQFADVSEVKMVLSGGNEIIRSRYINMHWRG